MVPLAGKDIPICLWQTGPFHLRFTPIPNQSWFTSDSKTTIKKHPGGCFFYGAPGRNRTSTSARTTDFESAASTSSATGALKTKENIADFLALSIIKSTYFSQRMKISFSGISADNCA